jgi:hypothetical protein
MKIRMIKEPGGLFRPADDMEYEKTTKFKTGEQYDADIKLSRNPAFLRKTMVFFHFCFNHWDGNKVHAFCSEAEQFDRFRKDLTILAGFYIQSERLDGSLRTEAESLAFGNMSEERFQECYLALIRAALKHIFHDADTNTENQLMDFF